MRLAALTSQKSKQVTYLPKPTSPLYGLCEALLEQALQDEYGIEIETDSSFRFRKILYNFRHENGPTRWQSIQIDLCPDDPEHRLWLLNSAGQQLQEQNRKQHQEQNQQSKQTNSLSPYRIDLQDKPKYS
jgi:hypothetical protein